MNFRLIAFAALGLWMPSIPGLSQGQNPDLQILEGRIQYVHVYEGEPADFTKFVEQFAGIQTVRSSSSTVFAEVLFSTEDLRKAIVAAGETKMSVPAFLSSSDVRAKVQFEFRENRYRLTIREITLLSVTGPFVGDTDLLDSYVLKKTGEPKENLWATCKPIFDSLFATRFTRPDSEKLIEEW
jgi:hypothetical protein